MGNSIYGTFTPWSRSGYTNIWENSIQFVPFAVTLRTLKTVQTFSLTFIILKRRGNTTNVDDELELCSYLHLLIAKREECCGWKKSNYRTSQNQNRWSHRPIKLSNARRCIFTAVTSLSTFETLEQGFLAVRRYFALWMNGWEWRKSVKLE